MGAACGVSLSCGCRLWGVVHSRRCRRVDAACGESFIRGPPCAQLVNSRNLSTQPLGSFDWSPDKEGLCVMSSFDQCVRVCIVTKLNKI